MQRPNIVNDIVGIQEGMGDIMHTAEDDFVVSAPRESNIMSGEVYRKPSLTHPSNTICPHPA